MKEHATDNTLAFLNEQNLIDIQKAMNESVIVAITNAQGRISYVNDKFLEISHYRRDEVIGQTHQLVNSGYHSRDFFKEMWRTIGTGNVWSGEIKNKTKYGDDYWVSTTIVPFMNDKGKPYQYVAIRTDITSRINMEKELQEAQEDNFQNTIKKLTNLIFKLYQDSEGTFRFSMAEGKMAEKLNFTTEYVVGKEVSELFPSEAAGKLIKNAKQAQLGGHVNFEIFMWDTHFSVHFSPIMSNGEVEEIVGTTFDITERKEYEAQIKYMAYHDVSTGLANRIQFGEQLTKVLSKARETEETFAILFLDLDRFKNINDTLGHMVGDELLKAVGDRLVESVRKEDLVARLGGDEFAIILSDMNETEAADCAERLIKNTGKYFTVRDMDIYISPSIGIGMYPRDGEDSDTLIKHADAAMYHAKAEGRNNFQFFNQKLVDRMNKNRLLENSLRKALDENEFILHYQPQIDIEQNKIVGVEALVRWRHKELGMISPGDFIPIAEETGLILPIGDWVLRTACAQNKAWQDAGYPPMIMAVNISMRQLMAHDFPKKVQQILKETNLENQYLELEITESLTADVQHIEKILLELREIGVKVSIDDFGSGYSSLSYLSKLPIDKLKIDQAFLREMNLKNLAVTKAIISLSHNLELDVIAEGVETEEQVVFLRENNCTLAQGYHYFKPMEAAALKPYLQ